AARGLGYIRWELLPEATRQQQQQQARDALLAALTDDEWVVRYAAVAGLQTLLPVAPTEWQPAVSDRLSQAVAEDEVLAVRARAALVLAS
ncbi:MAG: HEAT repeat domain-containing protein, partial [Cyanobacteria bacterium P01_A01_bin.135]